MEKPILLAAITLLLLTAYSSASNANLPNETAVGYPYYFNADLDGVSSRTPCALNAFDRYGTITKAWTIDANGFPLNTDRNGSIASAVTIDNSFAIDEVYSFELRCGGHAFPPQNVTIVVGGTSVYGITALNTLTFINFRQSDSILIGALIFISLAIAAGLYVFFRKRTMWA